MCIIVHEIILESWQLWLRFSAHPAHARPVSLGWMCTLRVGLRAESTAWLPCPSKRETVCGLRILDLQLLSTAVQAASRLSRGLISAGKCFSHHNRPYIQSSWNCGLMSASIRPQSSSIKIYNLQLLLSHLIRQSMHHSAAHARHTDLKHAYWLNWAGWMDCVAAQNTGKQEVFNWTSSCEPPWGLSHPYVNPGFTDHFWSLGWRKPALISADSLPELLGLLQRRFSELLQQEDAL